MKNFQYAPILPQFQEKDKSSFPDFETVNIVIVRNDQT